MSVSFQAGSYQPVRPMSSKLGTKKAENRKPVKVAFKGNDNQQAEDSKPILKEIEIKNATLTTRFGKFFKDIGKAFQTLFSNQISWRLDAVLDKFQEQIKSITRDKEAESVVRTGYYDKGVRQGVEELLRQRAITTEEKKQVEKQIKTAHENPSAPVFAIAAFSAINQLLSDASPKKIAESSIAKFDSAYVYLHGMSASEAKQTNNT